MKDFNKIILTALIVFLSRIPFIFTGFGTDPDGWRVIQSGLNLYRSGQYNTSRLPGYPVIEFFSAMLWMVFPANPSPWMFNIITALLSAVSVLFFLLIVKKISGSIDQGAILAAIAFSFIPVVYINSTNFMDYIWDLCFILASLYFSLNKSVRLSALLFAAAAGCRLTSVIMFIPLVILIFNSSEENKWKKIFEFIILFLLGLVLVYLPVLYKYGTGFLNASENPYPPLLIVLGRGLIKVWGITGLIAVPCAIFIMFLNRKKVVLNKESKAAVKYSAAAVVMNILLYSIFPYESGYLIPLIPFVIIIFYLTIPHGIFRYLALLFIVSPLFLSMEGRSIKLCGSLMSDQYKREDSEVYINEIYRQAEALKKPKLIISESYYPQIELSLFLTHRNLPEKTVFVYEITADTLKDYFSRGYDVYYLKAVDKSIYINSGLNLRYLGAKEL